MNTASGLIKVDRGMAQAKEKEQIQEQAQLINSLMKDLWSYQGFINSVELEETY